MQDRDIRISYASGADLGFRHSHVSARDIARSANSARYRAVWQLAKAASHLSITQPAVSQAVANLERAFGARLIDRGHLGAVLTSYGEAIQKRGMEVFDVLKQGSRDIEYLSDARTGDVWIGANEVLLGGFVPAVVQRLAEQRSNIAVHALTVNSSDFDLRNCVGASSISCLAG